MTRSKINPSPFRYAVACVLGSCVLLGGCNDAEQGALLGAGIGAMAGHAVGHDAESTLVGAAAGAGAGYIIGSQSDRDGCRRGHYRR
ncbi:MAG: YMGG-like glycine zipper-containing protein [Planctomycetota bacterium]|jgi:hypothetical protein